METKTNSKYLSGLKTATWLYWKCWEKDPQLVAGYQIGKIIERDHTHLIDSILSGVRALGSAFKSRLTPEIRQFGLPRICLKRYPIFYGEVLATWLGDKSSDPLSVVNVKKVLVSHLKLYGGLEEPMANLVADLFLQEVFESEINGITVPGFRRVSAKEKSTLVVLELIEENKV